MEIATMGPAPRYSQRADEKTGEAVKLLVVNAPAATLTEAEVIACCRKEFTAYKVPQIARFVDALPKSRRARSCAERCAAGPTQRMRPAKSSCAAPDHR